MLERKLIMAEGPCEVAFLEILLERDLLCFGKRDLLYERVVHERQFSIETLARMKTFGIDNQIHVYRVGDKLSDELILPKDRGLAKMIRSVTSVLTKPEFEILMLIKEGQLDHYLQKEKSAMKPSTFYKTLHRDYRKSSVQIAGYFGSLESAELVSLLHSYEIHRKKTHARGELSLYDLLSDSAKKLQVSFK